jgi:hypothetical protein
VTPGGRRVPGLGTALTLAVVRGMEEQGVRVVTTTATSHYSARIFAKMGWTEVTCTRCTQ